MATIPWNQSLSEQAQADLYSLYEALYKVRGLPPRNKQRAFEAAADGEHTWPITGITVEALKHLCTLGTCDGLRRAHETLRIERAAVMFERPRAMSRDELFQHFFELDKVVVTTAGENGRHGVRHWSEVIPVPPENFTRNGMKAVASDEDLAWACEVLKSKGIPFKAQYTPRRRRKPPAKGSAGSAS